MYLTAEVYYFLFYFFPHCTFIELISILNNDYDDCCYYFDGLTVWLCIYFLKLSCSLKSPRSIKSLSKQCQVFLSFFFCLIRRGRGGSLVCANIERRMMMRDAMTHVLIEINQSVGVGENKKKTSKETCIKKKAAKKKTTRKREREREYKKEGGLSSPFSGRDSSFA